jgi:hypothetical protein
VLADIDEVIEQIPFLLRRMSQQLAHSVISLQGSASLALGA